MRLTTDEYCDKCWNYVKIYTEGVIDNYIVVNSYVKKAIKKYIRMLNEKDKYFYNISKVDKVFKFFSFLNIEHKNKYVQFPLLPFQCFFLAFVFGFYYHNDTDKRVIKEAFLFIGRKNGKTALAAAIQLYGMLGDGISVPQSLLLANTAQQAAVALNFAKDMIVHTPELRDRLIGQRSRIVFKDYNKQGFCQIFSTVDSARLEGYSPSMAILDEVHNWTDNTVYNAIKTGTGARKNPLILIITTAGNKNNGFCNDYLKYHKNILDNQIEDDTTLGMIYQPDSKDDLTDPDMWIKANPALTIINSLDDMKTTFKQAQYSYADKYAFITKHLNIFWDTPDVWIPEEELLKVFEEFDELKLQKRDAYVGIDLSRNTDLTSVVVVIPILEEDMTYVIPYFFFANRPDNVIRKNGKNLSQLINEGHIIKCETKVIDLDLVYNKVIQISNDYNLVELVYDAYNAPQLVSRLKEYGINCEVFKQTAQKFNAPLKLLEEMIYNKKIKFKNPVMLWNFSNVVLYIDGNANIKIIKNAQNDSVDGVVALGEALGSMIENKYGEETIGLKTYLNGIKN